MAKQHGRPSNYSENIVKQTEKYLASCKDKERLVLKGQKAVVVLEVNIPSIEGLAIHLGVHRDTLYEWEKNHPAFSDILERVRQEQAKRLMNNGLAGTYHPLITKMMLSKHGYAEKSEVDHTSKGEKISGFNYIAPDDANNQANAEAAPGVASSEG